MHDWTSQFLPRLHNEMGAETPGALEMVWEEWENENYFASRRASEAYQLLKSKRVPGVRAFKFEHR